MRTALSEIFSSQALLLIFSIILIVRDTCQLVALWQMHIPVVWHLNVHLRAFVLFDPLEPDNLEGAVIIEWSKIPLNLWHRSFIQLSWILIFKARHHRDAVMCFGILQNSESCPSKCFSCKILCFFIWIIFNLNLQYSSQFWLEVEDLQSPSLQCSLVCYVDHLIILNGTFALHFWVFGNDHWNSYWNSYSDLLKGSLVLLIWSSERGSLVLVLWYF